MLTELIVVAMATWQVVEIWHHSSLMAKWRSYAELLGGRPSELLGCPFCLSVWASFAVAATWLAANELRDDSALFELLGVVLYLVIVSLASSRLANLGNDVFHRFCRTPDANDDLGDSDSDQQHEKEQP